MHSGEMNTQHNSLVPNDRILEGGEGVCLNMIKI